MFPVVLEQPNLEFSRQEQLQSRISRQSNRSVPIYMEFTFTRQTWKGVSKRIIIVHISQRVSEAKQYSDVFWIYTVHEEKDTYTYTYKLDPQLTYILFQMFDNASFMIRTSPMLD